MIQKLTDRYAVMGNPIAQSLSPTIHKLFAEQTQQELIYEAILVEPSGFAEAVKDFQIHHGKGLNVTLPFKEAAFALVDTATERARLAKAVNTLILHENGLLEGDNTDGIGLVRDLTQNIGVSLRDKSILLLGAGGAARGVVPLLLAEQPHQLLIANRTENKAQALVADFQEVLSKQKTIMQACSYENLPQSTFDVIIHATAAGTLGQTLDLPHPLMFDNCFCYDLAYSKTNDLTAFLQTVKNRGCTHYADGLGMLVEQAAESFYLWRGVRPHTREVIQRLHYLRHNNS
jgi:shikimate dehydrogenase